MNTLSPEDSVVLIEKLSSKKGIWANYNPSVNFYYYLNDLVKNGVLDPIYLPSFPDISEYQNLSESRNF